MLKRLAVFAPLFLLLLASVPSSLAGDLKLKARLIWGTNGEKPEGKDLKEVDSAMKEKLCGVFKWKNYYEVNSQEIVVPHTQSKTIKMSEKCDVEIKSSDKGTAEFVLIGEGKPVKKVKQALPMSESLVLAGEDKNETAWFVVLTPQ
ncbi:MAG: hypothetical protein SFY81_16910 [Verrucomicrobiota bacterium]|nr:hypothetical protein [Verrucomicrobiota bacterium]